MSAQLLLTKVASDLATAQATDLRTRAEKSMQCNQVKLENPMNDPWRIFSVCRWSERTWGPFPWNLMIFYQCRMYFMIFDQCGLYISTSGPLPLEWLEFTKQTKLQHLSLKEPHIFNSSELSKAEQMLLVPSQHYEKVLSPKWIAQRARLSTSGCTRFICVPSHKYLGHTDAIKHIAGHQHIQKIVRTLELPSLERSRLTHTLWP